VSWPIRLYLWLVGGQRPCCLTATFRLLINDPGESSATQLQGGCLSDRANVCGRALSHTQAVRARCRAHPASYQW
jgi:hypothetical protein